MSAMTVRDARLTAPRRQRQWTGQRMPPLRRPRQGTAPQTFQDYFLGRHDSDHARKEHDNLTALLTDRRAPEVGGTLVKHLDPDVEQSVAAYHTAVGKIAQVQKECEFGPLAADTPRSVEAPLAVLWRPKGSSGKVFLSRAEVAALQDKVDSITTLDAAARRRLEEIVSPVTEAVSRIDPELGESFAALMSELRETYLADEADVDRTNSKAVHDATNERAVDVFGEMLASKRAKLAATLARREAEQAQLSDALDYATRRIAAYELEIRRKENAAKLAALAVTRLQTETDSTSKRHDTLLVEAAGTGAQKLALERRIDLKEQQVAELSKKVVRARLREGLLGREMKERNDSRVALVGELNETRERLIAVRERVEMLLLLEKRLIELDEPVLETKEAPRQKKPKRRRPPSVARRGPKYGV